MQIQEARRLLALAAQLVDQAEGYRSATVRWMLQGNEVARAITLGDVVDSVTVRYGGTVVQFTGSDALSLLSFGRPMGTAEALDLNLV
jgi:hypothetical protein